MGPLRHREYQAFLDTPMSNRHFIPTPTTATTSDLTSTGWGRPGQIGVMTLSINFQRDIPMGCNKRGSMGRVTTTGPQATPLIRGTSAGENSIRSGEYIPRTWATLASRIPSLQSGGPPCTLRLTEPRPKTLALREHFWTSEIHLCMPLARSCPLGLFSKAINTNRKRDPPSQSRQGTRTHRVTNVRNRSVLITHVRLLKVGKTIRSAYRRSPMTVVPSNTVPSRS
jgi:hypothetical protein